ncbi:MAG: hypothetical protein ACRDTE_10330 [Pseudonocardiaceae bacterium]
MLLTGMAFAVVGKKSTDGLGIRPLLVQKVRPGAAYQYGLASIYNACSLMPLDELRRRGLVPAPDQYLDEYYPAVNRPEVTSELTPLGTTPIRLEGPSNCGVFLQRDGHVRVEVLQAPYHNDPGFIDRKIRDGTSYYQGGMKVVLPPNGSPESDEYRTAVALVLGPTAIAKIVVGLDENADPVPILKTLIEMVVPHLSAPPTREMALSYSPSDLPGPDACDLLREEDIKAVLGGPSDGFARRQASLAENRIFLNDGKTTYFTETTCERALARAGAHRRCLVRCAPDCSLHAEDLSRPGGCRSNHASNT